MTSLGTRILRFKTLPPVARGMVWMLLSVLAFVSMIMLVRHTSERFSPFELAFWRALSSLILMAPFLWRGGLRGLYTPCFRLHACRNAFHFIAIVAWFYAISKINLSLGISLQFTVPLFTVALAILVLGEKIDGPGLIVTGVGFSGVLFALRPGLADIEPVALITLGSAFCYAVPNIFTKLIARTDSSDLVVFYMNLMHLPLALTGALIVGLTPPNLADIPWLFAVGATGTLAHYLLAQALRECDAARVIPLDFLKLPLVALFAYLIFDQRPDLWSWAGGAIIFAATYYIVQREALRSRRRVQER